MASDSFVSKHTAQINRVMIIVALVFFYDYLSFLLIGIISSTLVGLKLVDAAYGEISDSFLSNEQRSRVRKMTQDKSSFLLTMVIVGTMSGSLMYVLKLIIMLAFTTSP